MTTCSTLGNAALMEMPKVSFLSSRKMSPDAVLGAHSWAAKIRETDTCVIGGFMSDLERDVLRFLLRGKCPIVIVEARKPRKAVPKELRESFAAGRILFVSLPDAKNVRVGESAAVRRNRFVLDNSERHVFGSVDPDGCLVPLLATIPPASYRILGEGER